MKLSNKGISPVFQSGRIFIVIVCVAAFSAVICYRLYVIASQRHEYYIAQAEKQYQNPSTLLTGRGDIYFSDSRNNSLRLASSNKKEGDKIIRVYPAKISASHVLGFVGYKGLSRAGQYGIEAYYDDILTGSTQIQPVTKNTTLSSFKKILSIFSDDTIASSNNSVDDSKNGGVLKNGEDIVLTIDPNVQFYVDSVLGDLLKKWSSPSGTIIVQDPKTGAIIAMSSSPSFDPNIYQKSSLDMYLNPAVQAIFEPGSSFKPFTMAAAINSGAVGPDTTYNDTGEVNFGKYTVMNHDKRASGIQTMTQVLERSLNTGVIFAQRKTGNDQFLNYVVSFGFGQKTGVDLSGEVSGNISNLFEGRPINFATASFGQGISVTPLQLINGISAIANDGKLMRPYLVKKIIHADGSETETKPKIIGSPISDRTAATIQKMLTEVVDNGFDRARISGYDVAGKTGTAQIPDASGAYGDENEFIHDFVGFAPSYDARFTILIKMDRPKGIEFASNSLTPVFADLAQFLLRYYNIPPTR